MTIIQWDIPSHEVPDWSLASTASPPPTLNPAITIKHNISQKQHKNKEENDPHKHVDNSQNCHNQLLYLKMTM